MSMKKTISRVMYFAVLTALVCIGCGGDDGGQTKSLEIGNILSIITGGGTQSATHTLTIDVTPANSGSVSRSSNSTSYKIGEQVTVTATPASGYIFTGWSGASNDTTATVTVSMDGDKSLTANFVLKDAPTYTLYVKLEPSGGGNVSREPNRTVYSAGEKVAVTAAAVDGYTFTGWSGDANGVDPSVTVTMNRDLTLTANFQQQTYTISTVVNPAQGGTVSREPYKAVYTYGEQVTVTVAPTDGYTFTGWSGDVTGTAKSVKITIDGNKTLTANFQQNRYTLTTVVSPSGYGIVLRNPNKDTYTYGEQVTVTATETPPSGDNYYAFNGWTGSLESKSNIVTITMDDNKTLTANFTRGTVPYYTLATTSNQDVQAISRNPDNASYREGATVTVTAPTVDGYTFTGWSGASTSTNTIVTVTMDGNKTLTANYRQLDYALATDVNPAIGGRVSRVPNKDRYVSGEKVTVNATANPGYKFVGWTGVSTSKDTSITITMNSNLTLTANFEQVTYTLETNGNPTNGGFVSRSPNRDTYTYNAEVTVTAEAANGYTFTGWTGTSTSKETSVTITMNGNKTLTANFQQDQYTLTTSISPSGGGTISRTPTSTDQIKYTWGTTVTVTATPSGCYMFTGWSGTGAPMSASTNPVTITMDGNKALVANFQQKQYTLKVITNGCSVSRNPEKETYICGEQVTVKATTTIGNSFVGWSGASSSTNSSVTITMDGNKELTANCQSDKYTLTTNVSQGNGGSILRSPDPDQRYYDYGDKVTVTAKAENCYTFTGWSGASTSTNANVTITMDGNKELMANFQQDTYILTTSISGSGIVSRSPSQTSYVCGTSVTLTATPTSDYYAFDGWTGAATGMTNPLTITINEPKTLTANFRAKVEKSETITFYDDRDYIFDKGSPATINVYTYGAGGGGAGGSRNQYNLVLHYYEKITGGGGGGGAMAYATLSIERGTTIRIKVGKGGNGGVALDSPNGSNDGWNYGASGKPGGTSTVTVGSVIIQAGGGGAGQGGVYGTTGAGNGGPGGIGSVPPSVPDNLKVKYDGISGKNGSNTKGSDPVGGAGGAGAAMVIDGTTYRAGAGGKGGTYYDAKDGSVGIGTSGGDGWVRILFRWWE